MKNINRYLKFFAVLLFVFSLNGCSTFNHSKAEYITIKFTADNSINPNYKDKASPVVINLYQLKNEDTFNSADFFELYGTEKSVLGSDLLITKQIILAPGHTETLEWPIMADAQYFSAVEELSQPEQDQWKVTATLNKHKKFNLILTCNQINLQEG